MHTEYHKEYSPRLGRDMEFKVSGPYGKPGRFFPGEGGGFVDFEGANLGAAGPPWS